MTNDALAVERPTLEQLWAWLAEVEDPEIPVISIVDLGIVRDVRWQGDGGADACVVTITPTYSGCPATEVIARSVVEALERRGVERVRLETRIAPAWTTDWLSEDGKRKLREYGIAPPVGLAAEQVIALDAIGRGPRPAEARAADRGLRRATAGASPLDPVPGLACPRCASTRVRLLSPFGSTPCKALYRCDACLEPFDHFKCH